MRAIHLKFFVFFFALATTSFAQQKKEGIIFENSNWKSILEKAKKQKKLVFLDAYTTWCGPCKAMQARVFPDQKLGEFYNTHFVNAKIDMEQGDGLKLANKYPIQGYPTLLFIDPVTEKVVNQALGYRSIEQLMKLGQQVASKTK
ncbi:MAG: thioredoxin family protein [Spirosomataceae bacterium]